MKKAIIIITILVISFISIIIIKNEKVDYVMVGVVRSISTDETILEDKTGNLWAIDNEGLTKNQKVIIYFNDNQTKTRLDDEVKKVEKI